MKRHSEGTRPAVRDNIQEAAGRERGLRGNKRSFIAQVDVPFSTLPELEARDLFKTYIHAIIGGSNRGVN